MNEKVNQWFTKKWIQHKNQRRKQCPAVKIWELEEEFLEDMMLLIQAEICFKENPELDPESE